LKVVVEEFCLEGRPVALGFDPGGGFLGFEGTAAGTDGELVEVAFEGVGGGGVVCDGFVVGVEEFAALAGGGVGHPDAGGVALEVDQGDAGGGDFVVVGVGFGVSADMAAFHDDGAQAKGEEATVDFKAVRSGFHEEEVVAGEVFGSPVEELFEAHVGVG
jgi:hypothetical protein